MASLPTTVDFENAKQDLDDLAQIINGDNSAIITTRLGGEKPSVGKVLADIDEKINSGHDALLTVVNTQATKVTEAAAIIAQQKIDVENAADEAKALLQSLLTEETILAAVEKLMEPSVAHLGSLVLQNSATAHRIKIKGVNAI